MSPFCRHCRKGAPYDDEIDFEGGNLFGHRGQPLDLSRGPAILDGKVFSFDPAQIAQMADEQPMLVIQLDIGRQIPMRLR